MCWKVNQRLRSSLLAKAKTHHPKFAHKKLRIHNQRGDLAPHLAINTTKTVSPFTRCFWFFKYTNFSQHPPKSMQHCIHGLFLCCNLRWKAQKSKVKEQSSKPKFTPKKPFQFTTGQEISRSVVNFDLTIYQILLILIFKCTNLFSLKPHET